MFADISIKKYDAYIRYVGGWPTIAYLPPRGGSPTAVQA